MAGYKEYVIDFKIGDGTTHSIPLKIPLGENGGYYTPMINQISETEIEISYVPSMADMPTIKPAVIKIPGSGGNVDLTGYATEQFVRDGYQPKGNYLTEHQDISGKLDASELPTAINTALAQAKESGEFDGEDGVSPTVKVSKIGKTAYITITDVNGKHTATINDGNNAPKVFNTTFEATVDKTVFMPSEIETNGKPISIDDWIVTPSGKVYVVAFVEDYGIEANYDETLAVEPGYVKTVNGVAPDANGNVKITIPDSGGNVDLTGYATEEWVQEGYQPKGEYLTEVPAGYAKTEDIPKKPEDIGAQPSGNYLTEIPSGYATEEFVKNKIAEAELGGEEVDLSGYAQKSELPTKVSQLQNDSGYLTAVPVGYAKTEDIPKNPADIGAQPEGDYALRSEIPSVPVKSVNGKTGAVSLTATDVKARPDSWMPTAQEVGALPNTYTPPNQTAEQVGADPKGTAASAVSQHNTADDSHNDIRLELKAINDRLTAFFDSDDQTLDELSEIVAYITSNKSLIDSITASKVNVADIINNLTTNVSNKPLSAAQGVVLKGLIDTVSNSLSNYQPKGNYLTEIPVVSVAKGGTGATDAETARTNLGITPANIGAAASSHNHSASNINSGTLNSKRLPTVPVTKGGTGATDAATARTNLGITPANIGALSTSKIIAVVKSLTFTEGIATYENSAILSGAVSFAQFRAGSVASLADSILGTYPSAGSIKIVSKMGQSGSLPVLILVINP